MNRQSRYFFVLAILLILASATIGIVGAQTGGEVRAVDLIGAWVSAGAPNGDFNFTGADGKSYVANFEADILPLFTKADVWFAGAQACTECHFDNSEDSYHEMDLSSYEGIMAGADVISKAPGEEIVVPGDWSGSKLRERMRNNRMPPGWEFDITEENRDGPTLTVSGGEVRAVDLLGAWVDGGAPNGDFTFTGADGKSYNGNFDADILPLFTKADVWFAGAQACTECHFDNSEDSYHEMDLSSYKGIMAGADVISKAPGEEIVVPGDWSGSKLRARMRNNRMPPGWEFDITEENRDGPTVVAGRAAPAILPTTGGGDVTLMLSLAVAGLLVLLAGMVVRRREQTG